MDTLPTAHVATHPDNDAEHEEYDVSLDMGCVRGLYFGFAFVAPFWLALVAILVVT